MASVSWSERHASTVRYLSYRSSTLALPVGQARPMGFLFPNKAFDYIAYTVFINKPYLCNIFLLCVCQDFLRASAMLKHVIDIGWTSVRLSVCPSVTRWYCIKTAERIVIIFSPHDSPFILVFTANARSVGNSQPVERGRNTLHRS